MTTETLTKIASSFEKDRLSILLANILIDKLDNLCDDEVASYLKDMGFTFAEAKEIIAFYFLSPEYKDKENF